MYVDLSLKLATVQLVNFVGKSCAIYYFSFFVNNICDLCLTSLSLLYMLKFCIISFL